jgi:hypothetical protein
MNNEGPGRRENWLLVVLFRVRQTSVSNLGRGLMTDFPFLQQKSDGVVAQAAEPSHVIQSAPREVPARSGIPKGKTDCGDTCRPPS